MSKAIGPREAALRAQREADAKPVKKRKTTIPVEASPAKGGKVPPARQLPARE